MFRIAFGSALLLLFPSLLPDPAIPLSCCSQEAANPASSPLDIIERMAGTWVALDDQGQPTDRVISKFSVTAGGSAVLEVLFPGTAEEMVSVYSVDDGKLVMDHYCLMGNQPRYEATVSADGKTIDWACSGGGNLKDHARAHMHQGVTRIVGEDRIDSDWTATKDGATIMRENFKTARVKTGGN